MSKFREWILTLGIAAAPGLLCGVNSAEAAGPQYQTSAASQTQNQQAAERIAAVLRTAQLAGSNIDITYGEGVCTLTGQVANFQQKATVSRLVSQVQGIQKVDNRLVVPGAAPAAAPVQTAAYTPAPQPAPTQTPKASSRRMFDPALQQVAHQSTAPCATESCATTAALPAALSNPPVFGNKPQAETQLASYTPPTPPVSNQEMAQRVGQALQQAQLAGQPVEIRYDAGRVVLLGSVATPQQREVAGQAARQVYGVNSVDNQLQVSGVTPVAYQPPAAATVDPNCPPGQPGLGAPVGGFAGPGYGAPGYGGPPMMMPPQYGMPGPGMNPAIYDNPSMPPYAWPATAQYPNSAAIQYPKQYSPSAFPYIGPFYPYPQVPPDWRKVSLEWDDGLWMLDFDSKTDKWWWFANPKNW